MSTAPVAERRRTGAAVWALRVAGAALLAVMGAIHLELWRDGYRSST